MILDEEEVKARQIQEDKRKMSQLSGIKDENRETTNDEQGKYIAFVSCY